MNRGENSDSIPIDLIPNILSRLPAKSIARFHCVSKLWWSLLHKPYFTELFLTRSSARPRLLIVVRQAGEWCFFTSPQPQNSYGKSSLVVAADFHTKISFDTIYYNTCSYASGLLYFSSIEISKKSKDDMEVICNPSTGQYAILPERYRRDGGFLGFDPIGKQFKVLVMDNSVNGKLAHRILTLGTETLRWRTIQAPSIHYPLGKRICINGVLYYISYDDGNLYLLGCFDVRSEKFKFVHLNSYPSIWSARLINYKGKLGVINLEVDYDYDYKLRMWVLEDAEKQEWSTYVYSLRTDENKVLRDDVCISVISVIGATTLGEIVLANWDARKPFYVFYFNPERNTLLTVEIQGLREKEREWSDNHQVCVFVDHVEDLKFNVRKTTYAITSLSRSEQRTSSKDYQVRTVTHQRQDRRKDDQVRTVTHQR